MNLCVLVENQHFQGGLSGVVEPFLCWTESDSSIEVVINEGDHVDVKVVENLIFRFKCSGIHESQGIVTYLIEVVGVIKYVKIDKVLISMKTLPQVRPERGRVASRLPA